MTEIELTGAEGFLRLSKALKEAARHELRKELNKGIRKATDPIRPASKAKALEVLPKRGGLAQRVAAAPQRVQTRTGRNAGVRVVVGKKGGGERATDRGQVRHPVFGHRDRWVTQKVTPGWFTGTAMEFRPQVIAEIEASLRRVVEQIAREV